MTRIRTRITKGLVTASIAILVNSSASANSFGLQSGLSLDNFPAGIQLEFDTDAHSSIGIGFSAITDLSASYKYFWNTTNHSGLFTEGSVGTVLLAPFVSVYLQQGYRWIFDNQVEFELKGGLGIAGVNTSFNQPTPVPYPNGSGYSSYNSEPSWRFAPLPTIGLRVGFHF